MAAQKLTKGRLVQIASMMTLLITAFIWRSNEHRDIKETSCSINTQCVVTVQQKRISIIAGIDQVSIESEDYGIFRYLINNLDQTASSYGPWKIEVKRENHNLMINFIDSKNRTIEIIKIN